MSDLKPCPFCGSVPAINYGHMADTSLAYVVCGCGVTTKNQHGDSDREAAKKVMQIWNRRVEQ